MSKLIHSPSARSELMALLQAGDYSSLVKRSAAARIGRARARAQSKQAIDKGTGEWAGLHRRDAYLNPLLWCVAAV